ncbi:hypothetical protein [Arthrobacter sp. B2a2-09]|uniref:hypothetical protein n=1 Tax=Arthrobacter sp. B2a2-09 TaxID=2952822 RepID=UPI0022CDAE37|nr:hypothetical protein [Arthrobacter sp. B2a2-09]MCZ9880710.1 hypothetical protein [Arthrobacter sp. B2a2-09]
MTTGLVEADEYFASIRAYRCTMMSSYEVSVWPEPRVLALLAEHLAATLSAAACVLLPRGGRSSEPARALAGRLGPIPHHHTLEYS